ncbi:MAG: hypothetical protein KDG89_08450 [Geminicoccaceae bacterium]|nr:hypothetical protein [Geminicoccaceae bacterium]
MPHAFGFATVLGAALALATPAAAALQSPGGSAEPGTVSFRWDAAKGAIGYRLWVSKGGRIVSRDWTPAGKACDGKVCGFTKSLDAGGYGWEVVAFIGGKDVSQGKRTLTVARGASVPESAPEAAGDGGDVLAAPVGATVTSPVTFAWNPPSKAIGYRLWLSRNGKVVSRDWLSTSKACDGGGCGHAKSLAPGDYGWELVAFSGGKDTSLGKASFTVAATAGAGGGRPSVPEGGPDAPAGLPYARSTALKGLDVDWSTFRQQGKGSDNWSMTWAKDDRLYAVFGDGAGIAPTSQPYVSIGLARFTGDSAGSLNGENLIGGRDPLVAACWKPNKGDLVENRKHAPACAGKGVQAKSQGVLALGGSLYAWLTPGSEKTNYQESRLYKATLGKNDWQRAGWSFQRSDSLHLLFPTFLQAGRDNADVGGYVYVYAPRYLGSRPDGLAIQQGKGGGEIYLLRAPRNANLMLESSWELFAGLGGDAPRWTRSHGQAEPVFKDENGTGWSMAAHYVKPLGRYVITTEHDASKASRLGMFEAPNPWGPWRVVFYDTLTGPKQPGNTAFHWGFLPNAFGADGGFTLSYTGIGRLDALNLVDGRFER